MTDELKTKLSYGLNLTAVETAELFGTDSGTIRSWVRKGMPAENKPKRGQSFIFDFEKVLNWVRFNRSEKYVYYLENFKER